MDRLKDKVIIITGASSGIGRAAAILYAKEGAKVVVSDIIEKPRPEGYEIDLGLSTVEAIKNSGGEAIFVQCDVTDVTQVENLIKTCVEKFGKLDILHNNAGIFTGYNRLTEKDDADWDKTMNINAKSTWLCSKYAIKQMLKQGAGGKIINTVSSGGIKAIAQEPDYCAAKGAQALLTRQMAIDYGPDGIMVNGICPGYIQTAMMRNEPQSIYDYVVATAPLRRAGTAEDVAKVSLFLASDDSDYITGQLLVVDGGLMA